MRETQLPAKPKLCSEAREILRQHYRMKLAELLRAAPQYGVQVEVVEYTAGGAAKTARAVDLVDVQPNIVVNIDHDISL